MATSDYSRQERIAREIRAELNDRLTPRADSIKRNWKKLTQSGETIMLRGISDLQGYAIEQTMIHIREGVSTHRLTDGELKEAILDKLSDVMSAKHVSDLPCARNALLAGIASGVGMGAIRGLSAGPMMAGHWAMATFTLVSLGSWHVCQKQFADERKKLARVIETMPKRTLKENSGSTSPATPPS
ncbi:hypothetical protein NLJ89_g2916 [Agrocybe chaxingu]|uniref:Cytochrome c oxidase assembly protein COX20, mitochondrial n=1 Tax=Agrocybe chaxingu TaxID=84603 RepID=A0A9W8K3H6_9AGAR|nr:hypothetical protein NLJ89_g2916 [Agrocybe chaxingu]